MPNLSLYLSIVELIQLLLTDYQ